MSRPTIPTMVKRANLQEALQEWQDALVQDLGGLEKISVQERALVDSATRTCLLLSRKLVPVRERTELVAVLPEEAR